MIKEWLQTYNPFNEQEAKDALREIMHEITLAGLFRAGFFEKAAFYGGTALRLFHGLDRYSEDLDFSLLQPSDTFSLKAYENSIIQEFEALGMKVSFREKQKSIDTAIDSAFLKSETLWRELLLEDTIPQYGIRQTTGLKIKLEVDTKPPLGFKTEEKLLLKPFSFYVKCFAIPDLFAGKMHALLFRKWGKNVKGRDWYDLEWYIRKGYSMNLHHFTRRAIESGDWSSIEMSEKEFLDILQNRITQVDIRIAKDDIRRFIKDSQKLNIWSQQYFLDLVKNLKLT